MTIGSPHKESVMQSFDVLFVVSLTEQATYDEMMFWPSDAIWHCKPLSPLVQLMDWCHSEPRLYLKLNVLIILFASSPRLERLSLNGCQALTDDAIHTVTTRHGL